MSVYNTGCYAIFCHLSALMYELSKKPNIDVPKKKSLISELFHPDTEGTKEPFPFSHIYVTLAFLTLRTDISHASKSRMAPPRRCYKHYNANIYKFKRGRMCQEANLKNSKTYPYLFDDIPHGKRTFAVINCYPDKEYATDTPPLASRSSSFYQDGKCLMIGLGRGQLHSSSLD